MSSEPTLLRIARIGAPHGLRGHMRLHVHTDSPQQRLAPGRQLRTDPDHGQLTIAASWQRQGQWYAAFEGFADRSAAEELRSVLLLGEPEAEPDAWYQHDLAGMRAQSPAGRILGTITGIEYYPAHDVLILAETGGNRTLVPFVREIVPAVDIPAGRVIIDPPVGLLADDEPAPEDLPAAPAPSPEDDE